jgi:hypothetical protein
MVKHTLRFRLSMNFDNVESFDDIEVISPNPTYLKAY